MTGHDHATAEVLLTFSTGDVKARCACGVIFIVPRVAIVEPTRARRACRRAACLDFYGPDSHIVGVDGPHAY